MMMMAKALCILPIILVAQGSVLARSFLETPTTLRSHHDATTFANSMHGHDHHRRQLNQEKFLTYEPMTTVTDDAAIDLDQKLLEDQLLTLTAEGFENAYNVYTRGAFSQSFALLTLDNDSVLNMFVPKGTDVTGLSDSGTFVRGKTMEDLKSGTSTIPVAYHVYPVQRTWTECHVGGNPDPVVDRCYAAKGMIELDDIGTFTYTYKPLEDNFNGQTLRTIVQTKSMGDLYSETSQKNGTYSKFMEYYGQYEYGNQFILAAFNKSATDFRNGNADFRLYHEDGRAEAIRRATIYLNVWMAIVIEMERAVDLCKTSSDKKDDGQLHAWDKAVAFYVGSVAKIANGDGYEGFSLFTMAQENCMFSGTCSDKVEIVNGESISTNVADVNEKIFASFIGGQRNLLDGTCVAAQANAERIIQQMIVPLLQGVLHFAYAMSLGPQQDDAGHDLEAEGAAVTAAVLPLIYRCNRTDAKILYQNMRIGNGADAGVTDFNTVMDIVQRNVECLGISCKEVGGVADLANEDKVYMEGGEPCHHRQAVDAATNNIQVTSTKTSAPGANVGLAVGVVLGLVVGGLLITVVISRKERSGKESDGPQYEDA